MPPQKLIVEDNPDPAYGLRNNLAIEGHRVEVVADGFAAIRRIKEQQFDLVLLDLMLPQMSGLKVLAYVRAFGIRTRALVLTALHEDVYRLRALKFGADAYVTKPFSIPVLLAEMDSVLRRPPMKPLGAAEVARLEDELGIEVPDDPTVGRGVYIGRGFVDRDAHCVCADGKQIPLTPHELELLLLLVRNAGTAVTKEQILRDVWGVKVKIVTSTVEKTVHRLRGKIEYDQDHPRHINTVHKVGYRFDW